MTDGEQLELVEVLTCPARRCAGEAPVQADGTDPAGRPTRLGTCLTCGRIVEHVDADAPERFHVLELPLELPL